MQDRNPSEMLTDNNQDEEALDPDMENGMDDEDMDDDDDDEDMDQEDDDVAEANSGNHSDQAFDPNNKSRNLNQVSHESNDSLRRRRKRAKVSKITGRNHKDKKKRRGDKDDSGFDYSSDFDPRSEIEEYSGYIQMVEGAGYALMRSERASFISQEGDILLPREMVQRFGLRSGHKIHGLVRMKKNRRQKIVTTLLEIQDQSLDNWRPAPMFHTLTSVNPFEFYRLSSPGDADKSMVLLELLTPIGKGQRGLIVAPPRTGKTILMEKIANGIAHNHPEVDIIVLLIDERPEEVTHLIRRVKGKVYASCLDKPIEEHIALTEMVIDIAQRKVEAGRDVVILLDSITRMSRAYNNQLKSSGRTLSGGVDAKALQEPKKFFGAARKLEEGGSLTIIATTLVQTGSQMDEVIFQEFKGTGNMELVLNRRLAEKRIYPAIDIAMSGTRREELILPAEYFKAATKFRRYLSNMTEANQMPAAIQALEKYRTTQDFVQAFA